MRCRQSHFFFMVPSLSNESPYRALCWYHDVDSDTINRRVCALLWSNKAQWSAILVDNKQGIWIGGPPPGHLGMMMIWSDDHLTLVVLQVGHWFGRWNAPEAGLLHIFSEDFVPVQMCPSDTKTMSGHLLLSAQAKQFSYSAQIHP